MEGFYNKSRIIMFILAIVVSLIMFINEDISVKLYGTFFITIITLMASFLVTPISSIYWFGYCTFGSVYTIFDSIIFEKSGEKE